MKKASLILFLFIFSLSGQGQVLYYLTEINAYNSDDSFYQNLEIYYDNDWQIDSAYQTFMSGHMYKYYYTNDTLREVVSTGTQSIFYYFYFDDSIQLFIEKANGDYFIVETDYTGDNNVIDSSYFYHPDGQLGSTVSFGWLSDNCVSFTDSNGEFETAVFNDSVLNPSYRKSKSYRWWYSGSYNYRLSSIRNESFLKEWEVISTLGNYPTQTRQYNDGVHNRTYYYDYETVLHISEQHDDPEKVLSVKYYNLSGQQIDKPAKGFYIECKITDQAVVSRKYFVQ